MAPGNTSSTGSVHLVTPSNPATGSSVVSEQVTTPLGNSNGAIGTETSTAEVAGTAAEKVEAEGVGQEEEEQGDQEEEDERARYSPQEINTTISRHIEFTRHVIAATDAELSKEYSLSHCADSLSKFSALLLGSGGPAVLSELNLRACDKAEVLQSIHAVKSMLLEAIQHMEAMMQTIHELYDAEPGPHLFAATDALFACLGDLLNGWNDSLVRFSSSCFLALTDVNRIVHLLQDDPDKLLSPAAKQKIDAMTETTAHEANLHTINP